MISRRGLPELLMNAWAGTILGIAAILAVGIFFLFTTDEAAEGPGQPSGTFPRATATPSRPISSIVSPEMARALGFDVLPQATLPPDNPITDAKVELGKLLFFDPRMSANSSISCASCHEPTRGWGDDLR